MSSHFINDLQDPKIFKCQTWESNWSLNTSGYFNLVYNYIPGLGKRISQKYKWPWNSLVLLFHLTNILLKIM